MQSSQLFSMHIEKLEDLFQTDSSSGLSSAEARKRRQKQGNNDLFSLIRKRNRATASPLMRLLSMGLNASLILLTLSLILGLFFENFLESLIGLLILILLFVPVFIFQKLFGDKERTLQRYSFPFVKVLRDGTTKITRYSNVVVGDICFLKKGDLIPADGRLITSHNLVVNTYDTNSSLGFFYQKSAKNADEPYLKTEKVSEPYIANMVFGGSVVMEGSGMFLVTSTGKETYVGSILYNTKISVASSGLFHGKGIEPKGSVSWKKGIQYGEFVSLILVVPVVFFLTGVSDKASFFRLLCELLVLAFACSGSLVSLYDTVFQLVEKKRLNKESKVCGRIGIPSLDSLSKIEKTTDVFMFGNTQLFPDKLYVESVFCSSQLYGNLDERIPESMVESVLVSEYSYIASSLDDSYSHRYYDALMRYAENIGFDITATWIRVNHANHQIVQLRDHNYHGITYEKGSNDWHSVLFSNNAQLLGDCRYYYLDNRLHEIDESFLQTVQHIRKTASDRAQIIRYYATDSGVFLGMVIFSLPYYFEINMTLKSFDKQQIKYAFFYPRESRNEILHLKQIGIDPSKILLASRVDFKQEDPMDLYKRYSFFFGFSRSFIEYISKELRTAKRSIASVCLNYDEYITSGSSGAIIGYDSLMENVIRNDDAIYDSYAEPDLNDTQMSAPVVRYNADVLVQRNDSTSHGPLYGILKAVLLARSVKIRLCLFLKYFLPVQWLRIGYWLSVLLFHDADVNFIPMLIVCSLTDVTVLLAILFIKQVDYADYAKTRPFLKQPFYQLSHLLYPSAVLCVVWFILSMVFYFTKTAFPNGFITGCFFLLQIAVFYVGIYSRGNRGIRLRTFSLAVLIPVALLAVVFGLSFLSPVNAYLGIEFSHSLLDYLLLLSVPAFWLIVYKGISAYRKQAGYSRSYK